MTDDVNAPRTRMTSVALAASGDTRTMVADPQARYFGAALDDRGLKPGDSLRIGPTRFKGGIVERND